MVRWTSAALLVLSVALTPLAAHPIHRSIAEATYDASTGALEVTVRVYADDFQTALSGSAGREISLAQTPAAEVVPLIRAYLVEHFIVKAPDGRLADQKWRRFELKPADNEVWLRFAVPLPQGVAGARIHHTVLNERFVDQLNSVAVRDGERKVTLVFLPNHTEKIVRFPPSSL